LLRDLPRPARWYICAVIAAGVLVFVLLAPHATLTPGLPLAALILLSSLTSAFKVQFPIASGSNMSVSYVVDIAALILRGPHATMIVGAASGWSQTTFNSQTRNPLYRTLFNMAILVLTVQTAGQVYWRLGGTASFTNVSGLTSPLLAAATTYFLVNTVPIAIAIALSTKQSAWKIWITDFARSFPSYLLGAIAAAVVIAVTHATGYWLALLFVAAPLYLTYKVYRSGVETEAKQGAILEAAHDAIVTMDQYLLIREFNPAAEQMFGYSRMDILGRSIDLLLPDRDRASHLKAFAEYLSSGRGPLARRRIELTGIRADGVEFPVELTVARLAADNRRLITGFVRDITERRALEEQLRQSQKLEAIGRLASGVAHDFNNILMSIMGSADLLLMHLRDDPAAGGEATEIKQSVQRGAGLTRQLLAFSRRQAAQPRLVALDEVVVGMDTMLRRLIGPEIDFTLIRPASSVSVVADPAQFEQVVLNLVINARDAMPEGGRLVVKIDDVEMDDAAATVHVEGRAGHYARLSVADTGTGMDDATRAKLFEPFFTTKAQGKGTGLGLSIVYGIVKQSGGHISVLSEPSKGATFLIHLPLANSRIFTAGTP